MTTLPFVNSLWEWFTPLILAHHPRCPLLMELKKPLTQSLIILWPFGAGAPVVNVKIAVDFQDTLLMVNDGQLVANSGPYCGVAL